MATKVELLQELESMPFHLYTIEVKETTHNTWTGTPLQMWEVFYVIGDEEQRICNIERSRALVLNSGESGETACWMEISPRRQYVRFSTKEWIRDTITSAPITTGTTSGYEGIRIWNIIEDIQTVIFSRIENGNWKHYNARKGRSPVLVEITDSDFNPAIFYSNLSAIDLNV